jgi:hypothetical protein
MLFQNSRYCLFICLIGVPEVMLRYSSIVCENPWQLFDLVAKGKMVHQVHIEGLWLLLVCSFISIEVT